MCPTEVEGKGSVTTPTRSRDPLTRRTLAAGEICRAACTAVTVIAVAYHAVVPGTP